MTTRKEEEKEGERGKWREEKWGETEKWTALAEKGMAGVQNRPNPDLPFTATVGPLRTTIINPPITIPPFSAHLRLPARLLLSLSP